ncbi:ribbon-helix-helix protein, CopG family [Pannus brasiliensis CCIBt3594]|uniref:Ribbon-helix-helix protein, CopG family n=1 Tax=Pannus brasiliensis CCIBt3594 TaxID=1427578 RepID=A0AAW9QED2_9CHRO
MTGETARLETTLPRPWLDRLRAIARERGQSIEEVTRQAIAAYLGISPIEMEIATLRLEIGEISKLSTQIAALHARLSLLEGRALMRTPSTAVESGEEDDYEDEPDEILNDFLPG